MPRLTKEEIDHIVALREKGKKTRWIARKFDRSVSTINYQLLICEDFTHD